MEYIKFHVDEMSQEHVFFEYRKIEEDKKGPLITRASCWTYYWYIL